MDDRNLWSKILLITVIVGVCTWLMWPPEQKLKPGIDLGGGHSLLFEVDDTGLETFQKTDLAARVMAILKQRVDPQGSRNLVWRPIGWNRIEIQMPRPPVSQEGYRRKFEEARQALAEINITEAQILAALAAPPDQRAALFDRLTGPVTERRELLDRLAAAHDEYNRLKPTDTQPIEGELARRLDELIRTRMDLLEQLRRTNIEIRVLSDILQLDKKSRIRQEKIAAFKKDHPALADRIDQMIAAYDEWSKTKGTLDDPSDLMRLLRGAGKLEFRILPQPDPANPSQIAANNPQYREEIKKYTDQLARYGPRPRPGDNFQWFRIHNPEENDITTGRFIVQEYLGTKYVLAHSTPDMGLINDGKDDWKLRGAFEGSDRAGRPAVNFELDNRGGARFGELTRNNLQKPLAIFLDDQAMSVATIQSEITTSGQITGNFSRADVVQLINTLNAGVLPARLKEVPLQQKSVGPSLGQSNRARGMQAVIVSLILIVAFMAVYYTYNGVIADIALLMNLVLTLGVMAFLQATFTLPGIAGLVLTMGMAVDANVLIFERMREELSRGVSARMAVKLGYEKAFSAILDGNVTTIITAIILGSLGSEEIKGFGLTLGIGLCTSMFTALFVTRQYFNVMVPSTLNEEETRKSWLSVLILGAAGVALMGVGYLFNTSPAERAESALWGLGQFVMVLFGTGLLLAGSMWLFRFMYRGIGHQQTNRLPMLKLMSAPNINWMAGYKTFWTISCVIIGGGFIFWSMVDPDQYLDIEFLGGTSVQIQIRPEKADQFSENGDEKLLNYVRGSGPEQENDPNTAVGWLRAAADNIQKAQVSARGEDRYLLTGYGDYTLHQMEGLLLPTLEDILVRGGIRTGEGGILLQFNSEKIKDRITDAEGVRAELARAADYLRGAANKLRNARVQHVEETTAAGEIQAAFEIISTETQRSIVAEALLATMGPASRNDLLAVRQPSEFRVVTDPQRAPDGLFPIVQTANTLADVIGGEATFPVSEYRGGVALVFSDVQPPISPAELKDRLREMRLQPDFEDIGSRDKVEVVGLEAAPGAEGRFSRLAVVVFDPSRPYVEGEDNLEWRSEFAVKELELVQASLASSRSLQRVTQFAPQVAGEAVQRAIIAVILSFIAIAAYLWIRFGQVNFGLAGVIALYHDVAVALSAVMLCHHIHDTAIGRLLMLSDFRIDLTLIAALLTIVGYSINDTIVIFDRIRENRGRMATLSASLINTALNQTLSRTIITSFTVLLGVVTMYVLGGEGIHGFAFAMIVGTLSGTYSTLAIATPLVHHPRALWVVTIVLATVTMLFVAATVQWAPIRYALKAIILGVAVWAMIRQWRATAGTGPSAEPAPA